MRSSPRRMYREEGATRRVPLAAGTKQTERREVVSEGGGGGTSLYGVVGMEEGHDIGI